MIIKFIGTGSGRTSSRRYHSSFLIKKGGNSILVDAGDGISRGLKDQKVEVKEINSIIFSHYHADHFGGIGSLVTQMKLSDRAGKLNIFTHKELIEPARNYLNYCYMFEETLGFEIEYIGFEFDREFRLDDDLFFIPRKNNHLHEKSGINAPMPVPFISSSFLFVLNDRSLFYTSDIGSTHDLYLFKDYKIDYMICETSHVSKEDIDYAVKEIKPRLTLLTHIDEGDEKDLVEWIKTLKDSKNSTIKLAFDGMELTI